MHKHVFVRASAIALALFAVPAAFAANSPVQIAKVIPYKGETGPANVRQCDWNSRLSFQIASKSKGQVVATTQDVSTLPGRTLRMAITSAHSAGGGSISGPKWGRVDGELWEDGTMIGNFSIRRVTNRPFALSVCGPLEKVADALSEDINAWLQHPTLDPNAGKSAEELQAQAQLEAQAKAGEQAQAEAQGQPPAKAEAEKQ